MCYSKSKILAQKNIDKILGIFIPNFTGLLGKNFPNFCRLDLPLYKIYKFYFPL